MHVALSNERRPDEDYLRRTNALYGKMGDILSEFKDLDQRVTTAMQSVLNGERQYSGYDINNLLDAQTKLDEIKKAISACSEQPADTVTVEMIRDTFYNAIYDALKSAVTEKLIDKDTFFSDEGGKMYPSAAAITLLTVLKNSADTNGILLLNRKVVNEKNCPEEFQEMIQFLLRVKKTVLEMSPQKLTVVKRYILNFDEERRDVDPILNKLIGNFYMSGVKVSQLQNFKKVARETLTNTESLV